MCLLQHSGVVKRSSIRFRFLVAIDPIVVGICSVHGSHSVVVQSTYLDTLVVGYSTANL
jgi:hypothetical protein